MNSIETRVKKVLQEQKGDVEIDLDDDLVKVGYNSMEFIKLVINLEQEFDIEFDDDYLEYRQMNTISKIARYIETFGIE